MPQIDRYRYRSDGNFFVKSICDGCGKEFDCWALANAAYGTYCPECQKERDRPKEGSNAAAD